MRVMASFETRSDASTHDEKGPALYTVSVLSNVIATVTIVLRLWVRRKRQALGEHRRKI